MLDIGIKRVLCSRIKGLFASYLMDMLSALHMTGASPKRLTLIGGEPLFLEPASASPRRTGGIDMSRRRLFGASKH